MPAVEHMRIDVAPDLRQIWELSYLSVEIRDGRNRDISPNFAAARVSKHTGSFSTRSECCGSVLEAPRCQYFLAQLGIHQLVHETQTGHRILGVERGRLIAGPNLSRSKFL